MSTLLLTPDTASVPRSKKDAKRKSDMTYQEAITLLRKCDTEIRQAAGIRTHNYPRLRNSLKFHTFLKTGAVVGATDVSMMFLLQPGTITNGILCLIIGGTVLAPILSTRLPRSVIKLISPVKAKNEDLHKSVTQSFYKMKEDHFSEIEAKILKKAQPALDVVNEYLKDQSRQVEYSRDSYFRHPGFKLNIFITEGRYSVIPLQKISDMSQQALSQSGTALSRPSQASIST